MKEICEMCRGKIPILRQKHHAITCSDLCYRQLTIKRHHSLNPQTKLSRPASGAVSEYRTIIDLLHRGFEVFRSVEPGASCDLAILKDNKLLRVEVKSIRYSTSGKPYAFKGQVKADILASVLSDTIIYIPPLE